MPLFYFHCPTCDTNIRKLFPDEERSTGLLCLHCGTSLERDPRGASGQVVERLDNGLMPKALERLADGPRMLRERNKKQQDSLKDPERV